VTDLGRGEAEVLALALEATDAVVVVDDALARKVAGTLGLRYTGTLDRLEALRFRVAPPTRAAVLRLAGEAE
jgi:hypothetical protein